VFVKMSASTPAPSRTGQLVQRRLNVTQGRVTNLDARATAIEGNLTALAVRPTTRAIPKTLTSQFQPNFMFQELRESDDVTVIASVASLLENYPARAPSTSYKLRASTVADYDAELVEGISAYHPRFTAMLPRKFSIKSSGPVDWSKGLVDGFVQIGKQSLVYQGDIRGPWAPATEYKLGDNVVVQAKYPAFMGMPAGQTMLFVFSCVRDHTSGDASSYLGFWELMSGETPLNSYLDPDNFPTIPRQSVVISGATTWRLNMYSRVRQFWPWNPATNSVEATLFTDAMDNLRYPFHADASNNFLLSSSPSSNAYHSARQEQGVIVFVDGKLTMWASNWWKTQSVKSSAAATVTFPLNNANKQHLIDGDLLWERNYTHTQAVNIVLPIDSRIRPYCRLTILPYSTIHNNIQLRVTNIAGTHLQSFSPNQDDATSYESMTYIFDKIRGQWVGENT